ncbi:MAG: DNA ligase LigA-related protein, partial [Anaerolineae bacterium]
MTRDDRLPRIDLDHISSQAQARQAVETLRDSIRTQDYNYYVLNDPAISDADYDRLMRQLRTLEDRYPDLRSPDSPTQQVGGQPREELGLVEHATPMLSLKAVYQASEVRNFDQSCRDALDMDQVTYVAEPKYDGLAVELIYDKGRFVKASTRGDGDTGEDVTANVKTIKEVPLVLLDQGDQRPPDHLVVRGEVYMRKDEFEALNQRRIDEGEEPFANPRNA